MVLFDVLLYEEIMINFTSSRMLDIQLKEPFPDTCIQSKLVCDFKVLEKGNKTGQISLNCALSKVLYSESMNFFPGHDVPWAFNLHMCIFIYLLFSLFCLKMISTTLHLILHRKL